MSFIGEFPTVKCAKHFNVGKDTLSKYIKNGLPYKGKIFSRKNFFKVFNYAPVIYLNFLLYYLLNWVNYKKHL